MTSNIFLSLYAAGYYARSTRFDDIVTILLKKILEVRIRSGPHLNIRRAAMRPAGRIALDIPDLGWIGLDIPDLRGFLRCRLKWIRVRFLYSYTLVC